MTPVNLRFRENVPLAPYTTFGVGGNARYFADATSEGDVQEAARWARESGLPLYVLGGGSNLLVPDGGYHGLVLHIALGGVASEAGGVFDAGAGVGWDELVNASLTADCAGFECLAGIPGSVGGTPVQNVGAYGQEVAETIVSVRAYDLQQDAFVELDQGACRFRYRASRFNTDEPGRYIVTRVRYQLRPGGAPTLRYAELARSFAAAPESPTLREVAEQVREIRRGKGMLLVEGDPDCRSAGSFFKNPVVSDAQLALVSAAAQIAVSEMPRWPAGDGLVKLPAAWLLEKAGFVKGYGSGPVRISSRHTLALTNRGGARFADVADMEQQIVEGVRKRFGVVLLREPVIME